MPQEMEQAAKVKQLEDAARSAPALRRRYTDADFARIASDDARRWRLSKRSGSSGLPGSWAGADNGGPPQDPSPASQGLGRCRGHLRAAFELLARQPAHSAWRPVRAGVRVPSAWQDATANANAISAPREGIIGGVRRPACSRSRRT